jgi:hypothetical protein
MTSQSAGARLTRRLTRYASLRTGYTYRVATSGSTDVRPRVDDLDVGIDFSRPVSVSRRTTVSFGTGSSMTPQDQGMAVNLTGNAALTRLMGRTWNTRLGVNRGVHLLEGFRQPVLANSINASLGGGLHRRLLFSSSASLSSGSVGLTGGGTNSYANWTAGSGLGITSAGAGCSTQ